MEKNEYIDNEKVLYKMRGKLSLSHKEPEEDNCLVTENHVVVILEEPIKIHLSRVKDCQVGVDSLAITYSQTGDPWSGTMELTFLDEQRKKRRLSLRTAEYQLQFQKAIYKQMVGRFFDEATEPPQKMALRTPFFEAKECFRDKTRDNICAGLHKLGIDAQMVTRGRVEESICGSGSLGIIYIPEGPIRWVNVRKETYGSGETRSTYYYTEYGIPDPRLGPDSPTTYIRSVRKKTSPLFGQVVDVLWEGGDYGTGVISRLNSEGQLKKPIMKNRDVTIKGFADYGCWIISTETRNVPSEELLNCYQTIAQHLLAEWYLR